MPRHLTPRALSLAGASAALVLLAAPALATVTPSTTGTTLHADSDGGSDTITIGCVAGTAHVGIADSGLACTSVTEVEIADAGGSDTINLGQVSAAAFPALALTTIDVADGGIDTVTGSGARDNVAGDTGDTVATAGGDDRVEGAKNADGGDGDDMLRGVTSSVQGGPGNDTVYNPGSGPIDGGPGSDTGILDVSIYDFNQGTNFEITDSAIIASIGGSSLTTPAASLESWVITLLHGNNVDAVRSPSYSGRMVLRLVGGNDSFSGGRGQDYVDGGEGNDVLDAGPGADQVFGGDGDDTISARDGAADTVDCGGGSDTVTADRVDVISNCESVSLPAPETGKVAGPKKVTKGKKATFTFESPVAGAAFECRVDKGAFKSCKSPFKVATKKLKAGKHTLEVRAVQPAGNPDASPSTYKFKVVAPK
jgi:Ca2+-binding RTX toxin-like protein